MAVFFSGTEVLEVAVRIEENGLAFYEQLMMVTKRPGLKAAYEYLAGQEKKHKQVFLKMQEGAGKSYTIDSYPGEEAAYIKSLADSMMFTPEKLKQMAKKNSDELALDTAMGLEKDSVLFYTSMLGIARPQDKKTVDWIISEEKSHVIRVLELKKQVQSGDLEGHGH
jgi:rubrerythrin